MNITLAFVYFIITTNQASTNDFGATKARMSQTCHHRDFPMISRLLSYFFFPTVDPFISLHALLPFISLHALVQQKCRPQGTPGQMRQTRRIPIFGTSVLSASTTGKQCRKI
jgi:hypothetical protein